MFANAPFLISLPVLCAMLISPTHSEAQSPLRLDSSRRFAVLVGGSAAYGDVQSNCRSCISNGRFAGPSFDARAGVVSPFGLSVELHTGEWSEIAFESTHQASFVAGELGMNFNGSPLTVLSVGIGRLALHQPDAGNGHAEFVSLGAQVRLPSRSFVGVTGNFDWLQAVSGRHDAGGRLPAGEWRPRMFRVGIGLDVRLKLPHA